MLVLYDDKRKPLIINNLIIIAAVNRDEIRFCRLGLTGLRDLIENCALSKIRPLCAILHKILSAQIRKQNKSPPSVTQFLFFFLVQGHTVVYV